MLWRGPPKRLKGWRTLSRIWKLSRGKTDMKDIKELALQVAEEINMKYADLNGDGLPGFCEELCTRFLAAYLKEQSAPSSEEVE